MADPKPPKKMEKVVEKTCKKVIGKVGSDVGAPKLAKKLADAVCKDADKKLVKMAVGELKKKTKKQGDPKAVTIPDFSKAVKMKQPGAGVPSIKIPLSPKLDLGKFQGIDAKAKFELKVWADPKDFEKKDKGGMVYFTVTF